MGFGSSPYSHQDTRNANCQVTQDFQDLHQFHQNLAAVGRSSQEVKVLPRRLGDCSLQGQLLSRKTQYCKKCKQPTANMIVAGTGAGPEGDNLEKFPNTRTRI